MPVYNMAEFVKDAIDSILKQTFSDFEFIIINDASNDDTLQILRSYTDQRIIICNNDSNIGNYASRNKALWMAKGKYVAVMDADDIARPDRLEKQIDYLETNSDVLAVGSDCIFLPNNKLKKVHTYYNDIQIALLDDNCVVHSSLMIRRDILCKLNGYNERYYYSSDYDLICRLVFLGKIENLIDPLMKYRWHSSQISSMHKGEQKKFTEFIRREYQLAFINYYKKQDQALVNYADISYPEMGQVIALYTYALYTGESKYEQMAGALLDDIFSNVTTEMPVCLNNGILGIGCGLMYLLRNDLVDGEEDDVLSEIDRSLFSALIQLNDESVADWYGWLHYIRLRILYDRQQEQLLYGLLLRQHTIYLLDCLARGLKKGMCWDKQIIGELEMFNRIKLCPTKTERLLTYLTSMENDHVTIVIPIRIDSIERERNLDLLLELLTAIDNININILEADKESIYRMKKEYVSVSHRFIEDCDPVFHRTKYLNMLLKNAAGAIVGVWDTDVVVSEEQILDAIKTIKNGEAIMSFPYDGRFCMLSPDNSQWFIKERSYKVLHERLDNKNLGHGFHSVGGAFFVNKRIYMQSGGENEYFYGWGPEDAERVKRMEILGLAVYRAKGPLFHLYHPRNENSWFGSRDIELQNRKEFLKVCSMSREELQLYIQEWKWV